jgi:hypothetical protein
MFQWSVTQLLNQLDNDPDVHEPAITKLEWIYFPLLDEHSERPPRILHSWMSKQAAFFVEVLTASQRGPESHADRLLESWSTVPGLENGILNGAVLQRWVEEAHSLAVKAGLGEFADKYIGRIVSHCPQGEDGIWPPATVRNILEVRRNSNIENGIFEGLRSKLGVMTRLLPRDGLSLERVEGLKYRKWAEAVELEWPQTAELLRRISDRFDEYALYDDEMAERTQWT